MCQACEEMDLYLVYRQPLEAEQKASASAPASKVVTGRVLDESTVAASQDLLCEDPAKR
jgi:hypothetical protein